MNEIEALAPAKNPYILTFNFFQDDPEEALQKHPEILETLKGLECMSLGANVVFVRSEVEAIALQDIFFPYLKIGEELYVFRLDLKDWAAVTSSETHDLIFDSYRSESEPNPLKQSIVERFASRIKWKYLIARSRFFAKFDQKL